MSMSLREKRIRYNMYLLECLAGDIDQKIDEKIMSFAEFCDIQLKKEGNTGNMKSGE